MLAFWIIAAVVLLGIELLTPGFLVIFFSVSAIFAAITSLFSSNIFIQCTVFILAAILMIPFGRPLLQKYFNVNKEVQSSTVDALVGKKAFVTKDIKNDETGLVKFEGRVWSAISISDEEIKVGEPVKIVSVEGVKVVVTKNI